MHIGSCLCVTAALTASALSGQQEQPQDASRTDSDRFRINRISVETAGNSLRFPGAMDTPSRDRIFYLTDAGMTDFTLALPGRQTRAELDYTVRYNWNPRYPTLRGFDHTAALTFRREFSRLTVINYGVSFESRLVTSALFDSGSSLGLAQSSYAPDQIAAGLTGRGGLSEISPIDLMLFGARITTGMARAGFARTQSPRVEWTGNVSLSRMIRGNAADPAIAAQYPSAMVGEANINMIYSLSRRTRIAVGGNYMHSRSRRYRFDWEQASVDLQRMLGRRTFAHGQVGYGRVEDRLSGAPGRNAYTVAAGIGTLAGDHTIIASLRRGGADYRGAGVQSSIGAEVAWSWMSVRAGWSVGMSAAYERLAGTATGTGTNFPSIDVRVLRAMVSRQLTMRTSLTFESAYLHSVTRIPMLLAGGGVRIIYSWSPAMPVRQPGNQNER